MCIQAKAMKLYLVHCDPQDYTRIRKNVPTSYLKGKVVPNYSVKINKVGEVNCSRK